MKERCFLVIAPHPDDAELGMGGTILSLKARGHRVVVVDLTSGEPTPFGKEETRQRETACATRVLGIDERYNLGLPNRYLFDNQEARLVLAERIRLTRPDILFCPQIGDAHPDHVAAANIAEGARFYAKYTKLTLEGEPWYTARLFRYSCSHLRTVPAFNFLIDISEHFDGKLEAVRCYRSQFMDNPNNRPVFDYVKNRDSYFGGLIGKAFAEPFSSEEALGAADPAVFLL
jgi:bacillithiol biosynthesis deacetylase BshB1